MSERTGSAAHALFDDAEVRDVLRETFYEGDAPPRRPRPPRKVAPKAELPYEVICISLYKEDLAALDAQVTALKASGHRKMSRSDVTRGEFAAFVAATGHKMEGDCYRIGEPKRGQRRDWRSPGFAQDDRHPVVCVSWHDAKGYVAWLSSTTGKQYRLLSEAEREFVARAGTTTPFWWGGTISTEQANYDGRVTFAGGPSGEVRHSTVAVDSFLANPWGLYNVHGNVSEWVEDCWDYDYSNAPVDGSTPIAPANCRTRVHRSGSWLDSPVYVRAAARSHSDPILSSALTASIFAQTGCTFRSSCPVATMRQMLWLPLPLQKPLAFRWRTVPLRSAWSLLWRPGFGCSAACWWSARR